MNIQKYAFLEMKESLLKNTDADKRMDVIFHFATPEVFWNENITLFDRNGKAISKGTPNVLVTCDMADTYWRLFLDEVLTNVQVHEFESVQEYAQTIGNSMLLSRSLNNVEKIGNDLPEKINDVAIPSLLVKGLMISGK